MIKRGYLAIISLIVITILIVPMSSNDVISTEGRTTPSTAYNLYFGDLHSHTGYSDGYGTPAEAYQSARDGGADFFATTDHVYLLSPEEWSQTTTDAAAYTTSTFVALPGYEYWLLLNIGEMNVFGCPVLPPDPNTFGTKDVRLANYYDWLANQSSTTSAMWNHPDYMTTGYPGGEYDSYGHFTSSRDLPINLYEIHNLGSYLWQGTVDWESAYVNALEQGWHIMPTANSDTHATDWIIGYDVRTALLAPDLTAASIYDAMRACRGYATQDKNLRILYTLNGEIMGSELSPTESTYTASVHIEDPDGVATDAITMVEIISDAGAVVESLSCNSDIVDWTVTLSSSSSHYYYVRVTTASSVTGGPGVTAWTAPVWTGR
jgi:hypothetical protein